MQTKIASFASIVEDVTWAQAERTASMPFVQPHLALMPDAHLGKGATVGSVIPTVGAIIPAAVGVDIGCGMIAVQTQYRLDRASRGSSGAARGDHRLPFRCRPATTTSPCCRPPRRGWPALAESRWSGPGRRPSRRSGRCNSGTLGSGNHFIEVSIDENDQVWLFLHSGQPGRGQQAGHEVDQGRSAAVQEALDQPARPRPGLPGRGRRRILGLPGGAALGAALRRPQPRGDDGPRRGRVRAVGGRQRRAGRARSTATTTTPPGSATWAGTCGCPARGRSTHTRECRA